jgi:hypothetical protein
MTSKRWISIALASFLAAGAVSLGSAFETEAVAANQSWNYKEECWSGCSNEETDEYYHDGAYGQEVQSEPGPGNREEMLELSAHSQSWCAHMLGDIANIHTHIYNHDYRCETARLGW